MKKIIVLIIIFAISITCYCRKISSKSVSKKIMKIESKDNNLRGYPIYYDRLRVDIDFINLLEVNYDNDTIFLMQSYNVVEGFNNLSLALWNNGNVFFYQLRDSLPIYKRPNYTILDYNRMQLYTLKNGYSLFPKFMMQLVNMWDINNLKNESKINGMMGGGKIIALRLVFKNNKYTIESINFEEFFNFKRDYTYLPYSDDIYISINK